MMEEWRDIAGYEGLYQVSNLGRVRSLDRMVQCANSIRFYKGKEMKLITRKDGYIDILLQKAGCKKRHFVHRLVAQAFIPNTDNLPDINHKDEDKANNAFSNLEWCNKTYNNNYGTRKQRADDAQHKKIVLQYDLKGNFIREHIGIAEAARAIGKPDDATSISKCCNGMLKYSHGFIWRFKEVT